MNSIAGSRVVMLVLALATGLAAHAQDQPVERKQQTKQDQRMYYQRVNRHDQETMLEDPAITNSVTDQQIMPDSNEQNVESRVLTLDDLQRTRFVAAPVASEGMEFVPGKGYVAGRTEQATEPGMGVLAPTLGFQLTGGLNGAENSPNAESFPTAVNPGESGPGFVSSKAAVDPYAQPAVNPYAQPAGDPYAQPPDPLLSLQPFRSELPLTGIGSALERRPAPSLPATDLPTPESSLRLDELTEPSPARSIGRQSSPVSPFRRSEREGPGTEREGRTTCKFKVNPATIHNRVERERLARQGCLTRPFDRHTPKAAEGRD
ncbi:MAG: hypothetical protein WA476_01185 [Acidobacteriaceae bacterium]